MADGRMQPMQGAQGGLVLGGRRRLQNPSSLG